MPDYISVLLIIFIFYREYISYRERKDLYDRLMSKDLPEFKELTEKQEEEEEVVDNRVSLEDARDELTGEIDEN
jgi:hypothetical protein